jgi:hypothetical protein
MGMGQNQTPTKLVGEHPKTELCIMHYLNTCQEKETVGKKVVIRINKQNHGNTITTRI